MFSTVINNGMRRGIPKELWKGVVTVYADGDKVQRYTGNQNPNNARVILLNKEGNVIYFYDRGFSVEALNSVRALVDR
jgi:cytochrome oxidase Cu insertion factor (SCO1/SenC/PrrC family)